MVKGTSGVGRRTEGAVPEERRGEGKKKKEKKASLPNSIIVVSLQPVTRRYFTQLSSSNISNI